jgi:hypothetical protein
MKTTVSVLRRVSHWCKNSGRVSRPFSVWFVHYAMPWLGLLGLAGLVVWHAFSPEGAFHLLVFVAHLAAHRSPPSAPR